LLGKRRKRRWSRELEDLRTARFRHDEARRQYLALLEECRKAQDELESGKRSLLTETQALEQMRTEVIGRTGSAGDKRLERLRREAETLNAAAEKRLGRERKALQTDLERLEQRQRDVQKREEMLLARHKKFLRSWTASEKEREETAALREKYQLETQRLQAQHTEDEQRLTALREELERIAHVLIDEGADSAAEATQAA
jgi:hypothetical protein